MSRLRMAALCSVFAGLSACDFGVKTCRDGEPACPTGSVCDMASRYCVSSRADAATGGGVGGGGPNGGGGANGGGTNGGGANGGGGGMTGGGGGMAGGGGSMCGACNGVGQECVVDTCVDVALEMAVDVPATPIGALPVDVSFHVRRLGGAPAGGVVMPTTVTVTPSASFVTSNGMQLSDGGYAFTARSTAVNSNTAVNVDLAFTPAMGADVTASALLPVDTRPTVATVDLLQVQFIDAGARGTEWNFPTLAVTSAMPRRDETVLVRVSSAEAFSAATLLMTNVSGTNSTATSEVACPMAMCMSQCRCFEAQMWALPMRALKENYAFRFSGTNGRGIVTDGGVVGTGFINASGLPTLEATRMRWKVGPTGGDAIRATPAIDAQGALYFGSMRNATAGSLYALGPNGKLKSAAWDGGISVGSVTSVAVSPTQGLVYFTASDATIGGYLSARTLNGGLAMGSGEAQCKGSASAQRANTAMALMNDGTGVAGVTAFGANAANFGFCKWNPDLPDSFAPKEGNDRGPYEPDNSTGVSNLIVTGGTDVTYAAHFTGGDGGIVVVRRALTSAAGSFTFDARTGVSETELDNGLAPVSLMDTGPNARAALSTAANGLFKADPGNNVLQNFAGMGTSKVAVDVGGNQWVWSSGALFLVNGASNAASSQGSVSSTIGAPVLGQDSMGGRDRVYVVTRNAELVVTSQFGAAAPEQLWTGLLPLSSSSVSASPTLDCNRLAPMSARARTGVLYIVTNQGEVVSVVVDSPKLDAMAKWPKFQHDIFNSGNTTLNFNDGCP